ncbi:MAG TPA: hypothetical protein VF928_01115 [Usitatibacteraceae bacterium]
MNPTQNLTGLRVVPGCGRSLSLLAATFLLNGCAAMLPDSRTEVRAQWKSYAEARATFDQIVPGKTTVSELAAMGIDAASSSNVTILNQADLLRRFVVVPSLDTRMLDDGLRRCLEAREACFAYTVEQTYTDRKRTGNFLLDFLNFHRHTEITGWKFEAIIVINIDTVAFKVWGGKPNIQEEENVRNPLGPLQGVGESGSRQLINR